MRKLSYFVGMSLDGYIAASDDSIDFFPLGAEFLAWLGAEYPETLPTAARPHFGISDDAPNRHYDTIVMGRGTYRPGLAAGLPNPYAHLKTYVVSSTLGQTGDPAVELVESDPLGLVQRLKKEEGLDIWLGGGKLGAQLIDEIDELVIKSYPVIAGDGVRAFTGNFKPTNFKLERRKDFEDGTQVSWFSRA
ncbi:dihydrofolate reductase [Nocardia uniformis]|uniref:Dihydrofolate reductase n=1 Tax=Nocardia uniformis TaxID=53432 RepID=A0A849CAK3_9NOCA|nr:dihydrofolate reductase family protein [Nocardia uniformis]NNH74748.1 dihydrofolate reductase [Nocardia uniformis]